MVKELLAVCPLHQQPEADTSLIKPRHSDLPGGRVWLPVVPPKVLLKGGHVPFFSPEILVVSVRRPCLPFQDLPYSPSRGHRGTFQRPRYSSIPAPFRGHTMLGPAYLPEAGRIPSLGYWALAPWSVKQVGHCFPCYWLYVCLP